MINKTTTAVQVALHEKVIGKKPKTNTEWKNIVFQLKCFPCDEINYISNNQPLPKKPFFIIWFWPLYARYLSLLAKSIFCCIAEKPIKFNPPLLFQVFFLKKIKLKFNLSFLTNSPNFLTRYFSKDWSPAFWMMVRHVYFFRAKLRSEKISPKVSLHWRHFDY